MAITSFALPTDPGPTLASPVPLDFGAWQEGAMGGPDLYLGRLGNRWAMEFTLPALPLEPYARIWSSALVRSIGKRVRVGIPQNLDIGNPGAPVVDGAGQVGTIIVLRGLTVGYVIRDGQWLTFTDGFAYYTHLATEDAIVAGDGRTAVKLWPMVRTSFANGAAVNIAAPVIEGRLEGSEKGWTMDLISAGGVQFRVRETR